MVMDFFFKFFLSVTDFYASGSVWVGGFFFFFFLFISQIGNALIPYTIGILPAVIV